ncbi:hypothetical protein ACFV24_01520 [Nocardia fluminea]|uniref:hypothetical protein n=1 Tax=Nocardia fluminea TaxID=134984 RepID=UPI00366FA1CA
MSADTSGDRPGGVSTGPKPARLDRWAEWTEQVHRQRAVRLLVAGLAATSPNEAEFGIGGAEDVVHGAAIVSIRPAHNPAFVPGDCVGIQITSYAGRLPDTFIYRIGEFAATHRCIRDNPRWRPFSALLQLDIG